MNTTNSFLRIHKVYFYISIIQLDAKYRNLFFVVVEDIFSLNPLFFFSNLKIELIVLVLDTIKILSWLNFEFNYKKIEFYKIYIE
jgi:hypothetical protein